jgi:hypothetical protein
MFWYVDPFMRFCLDMNQGGAMVDLRPYAAKLIRPCGVGTKANQDASYPFLVQSLYRAGFFTHYAGEGAVKSCKIGHGGEQVDPLHLPHAGILFERRAKSRRYA